MKSYFQYLFQMTKDIFCNLRRIFALAQFEYKLANKGLALGQLWLFINPLIQIGIYWLVFGIGIRSGRPVDGFPYVVWLTCGLAPWLICNRGVSKTASAIYSKAQMLTRSNIPTCLIPLSSSLAVVMDSGWTVLIMILIHLGNGCRIPWTAWCLLYYLICSLAIISVCSLITSVLVMLARDFSNLIQALMRMMFFVSPIFWDASTSEVAAIRIMGFINPFGYIIDGFRDSMLYSVPFWQNAERTLVFWGIVLVMYLLGACFQQRLRKNLLDFI